MPKTEDIPDPDEAAGVREPGGHGTSGTLSVIKAKGLIMGERIHPERGQPHSRESANPPDAKPRLATIDPSNEQPGPVYEGHSRDEALVIAREVRRTWETWRRTSFFERAVLIRAAAQVLRRRQDEFAGLMTAEMGKTLTQGRAEIEKCAFNCDYFAENAERFLARQRSASAAQRRS